MLLLTAIVMARAILSLPLPDGFSLFSNNAIQGLTFWLFYFMMLTNGFGMLLLTKEKTDEKLKEVMDEQKAILDTLPTGLCILRDRVIEQCNPAMEVMFGFAPGDLLGKSVKCLYKNDELYEKYGRKIYSEIEKKGHFNGEVNYIRQNGEQFWAKDMGATIFHERSQSHAVFCITDISEQKKQQEVLASQKEELEETLTRIKRLEGILSICMCCKKIRAGEKSWDQLEKYITEHADVHFSHGICPDCYEKYKADEFKG
jgi:PAS domain S-box-containing protein